MKTNMGNADRLIRIVLAALAVGLYLTGIITGTIGIVLLVFAGVFLLTSIVGTCPLYMPFGWSTCARK